MMKKSSKKAEAALRRIEMRAETRRREEQQRAAALDEAFHNGRAKGERDARRAAQRIEGMARLTSIIEKIEGIDMPHTRYLCAVEFNSGAISMAAMTVGDLKILASKARETMLVGDSANADEEVTGRVVSSGFLKGHQIEPDHGKR